MKKIINKNTLFGFIIGGIMFSIIGVSAAKYMYSSDQVSYKKSNNEEVDVKVALDELYDLNNQNQPKELVYVGTSSAYKTNITFDLKSIEGYEKITNDDFVFKNLKFFVNNPESYSFNYYANMNIDPVTYDYNQTTGILKMSDYPGRGFGSGAMWVGYDVYVLK